MEDYLGILFFLLFFLFKVVFKKASKAKPKPPKPLTFEDAPSQNLANALPPIPNFSIKNSEDSARPHFVEERKNQSLQRTYTRKRLHPTIRGIQSKKNMIILSEILRSPNDKCILLSRRESARGLELL